MWVEVFFLHLHYFRSRDYDLLFQKLTALSPFVSRRTSYSSTRDCTCVWVPVMSILLSPCATPQTNTSSGPLSKCANHHFTSSYSICIRHTEYIRILYCMQLFFRSMTLSFNLFLYIEEVNCCCWRVWTLGEIQCFSAGRKSIETI